ncbi:CYSTEINE-RICH REPEAT SECRETORY PROTEIN 38-LIKE [Salix koriyanagi]|uniref:CYSTEINE-RICH REPEAT SECRETORY PROTEIN 38-LIKE n=1 Tax=Salix koriyanagi TaxID=2511006 RepID=A0A9Q0ZBU4_9ROSI|nr:CYSTEINE-RICH REPEAT SECRETORY PROTEIN 38-LIKE [Salix koriyanagi]
MQLHYVEETLQLVFVEVALITPLERSYRHSKHYLPDLIIPKAASGNSSKKFASGNQSVGVQTAYAIAQCTPDLSGRQCSSCLRRVFMFITNCCDGNALWKIGVRLITQSCNLRWVI